MPALNLISPFNPGRRRTIILGPERYNPRHRLQMIFDKTYTVSEPMDPSFFHLDILDQLGPMLDLLEEMKLIDNKHIYRENRKNETLLRRFTTKEVLLELLDQNLMNSIEAASKKWRPNNYIGSKVRIRAFREKDKLCIQIIDNGGGFPKDILPRVGNESLSSRSTRSLEEFYFSDALGDHLFKAGQLAQLLGWSIIAENDRNTGGGSVSIVLPLPKDKSRV